MNILKALISLFKKKKKGTSCGEEGEMMVMMMDDCTDKMTEYKLLFNCKSINYKIQFISSSKQLDLTELRIHIEREYPEFKKYLQINDQYVLEVSHIIPPIIIVFLLKCSSFPDL